MSPHACPPCRNPSLCNHGENCPSASTYRHRPWHSRVLMAIGCGLIVYVIGVALDYWPKL